MKDFFATPAKTIRRLLTSHIVEHKSANLTVTSEDEPGQGGARHRYEISGFDTLTNNSTISSSDPRLDLVILFQNGPIGEYGTNGITHEALLAILIDRLQSFQAGPYACRENAIALANLEDALMWLQKRTRDRIARNVEGTHEI